jgi:hypothetical protein
MNTKATLEELLDARFLYGTCRIKYKQKIRSSQNFCLRHIFSYIKKTLMAVMDPTFSTNNFRRYNIQPLRAKRMNITGDK